MNSKLSLKILLVITIAILMTITVMKVTTEKIYAATDAQTDSKFEQQLSDQGFPESYKVYLRELHEKYPKWSFKAKHLDYSWSDALNKQYEKSSTNTIAINYPDAWKAVKSGTYNFTDHYYIGKDGASWVSAGKACVAYYMDPRNWLSEDSVFIFEDLSYDSSFQTEDIVKKILATTKLTSASSKYYMQAASTYDVSPIYLAAKSRMELGTSSSFMIDGHSFTYGGKTYSDCYNAFNIGAYDSADGSAALKGLVYAAGGADGSQTSYGRPWNTLAKAIKGGAAFIADGYINNNQYSLYTERFNVLNGLSSVGSHQYATNIMYAAGQGQVMYDYYDEFNVLNESFCFEIPVFKDMPDTPCQRPPSSGNNNYFLDSLSVTVNGTNYLFSPSFSRFTKNYTLNKTVPSSVSAVTVKAVPNDSSTEITVLRSKSLKYGDNKIAVKCKSSSGLVTGYYYINITREQTKLYIPSQPKNLNSENQGGSKVKLSWTGDSKATGYKIGYKRDTSDTWYYTETTKPYLVKTMLTKGIVYDYKVRAFYEENGERTYSDYTDIVKQATFGDEEVTVSGSLYNTYKTVKITWNEVTGATGYRVYYSEKDTTEWRTASLSKTSFQKIMAEEGKGYQFKIIPYMVYDGVRYYEGYESPIKTIYTLKKPVVTLETKYVKSIFVKWNNISGESGYDVYRSVYSNKGFTKIAGVSYKDSQYQDKGKTPGQKYYYKIRAYKKTVYGTYVYGPYSTVKSIIR